LPDWFLQIVPALPAVWGGVSFILFALLFLGLIGTWRLRWATSAAPQSVQELADGLANSWSNSRTISVRICRRIGEPILLGIWRPLILLPPCVLIKCRPEQLELILLHELAHIRRRDNLVLLVQRSAEVLFWFQPAIWMVSRWITTAGCTRKL
jgi:beta-lactamase regulating signal transducer with metallopeptidase domain